MTSLVNRVFSWLLAPIIDCLVGWSHTEQHNAAPPPTPTRLGQPQSKSPVPPAIPVQETMDEAGDDRRAIDVDLGDVYPPETAQPARVKLRLFHTTAEVAEYVKDVMADDSMHTCVHVTVPHMCVNLGADTQGPAAFRRSCPAFAAPPGQFGVVCINGQLPDFDTVLEHALERVADGGTNVVLVVYGLTVYGLCQVLTSIDPSNDKFRVDVVS